MRRGEDGGRDLGPLPPGPESTTRPPLDLGRLSPREREILELALSGMRATAIARQLVVAPSTVRNHLSNVYRKLEVDGYDDLVTRLNPELPTTRASRLLSLQAQEAVWQDAWQLRMIAEAAAAFVGLTDPFGRPLWVSTAGRRLTGLSTVSPLPDHIAELHTPWAAEIVRDQGIPAASSDGVWHGSTALAGPNGGEIPVEETVVARWDATGRPAFLIVVCRT